MPKDSNEVEQARQRDAMLNAGYSHNEIHNPNIVSHFNATGQPADEYRQQHQSPSASGQPKSKSKSGCALVLLILFLPLALGIWVALT